MSAKSISLFFCFVVLVCAVHAASWSNDGRDDDPTVGIPVVRKDERISLVSTEYGEISAVRISEGAWGPQYHLQFITMEPNALLLPALLHADMVFYVHSGSGRLSWADEDKIRRVKLRRGDVYRLPPGAIFFVQSNLDDKRQKLRIYAIFSNPSHNLHESAVGAYSSINDLVLGFDKKVLQSAFQVTEEMIEELTSGLKQQAIVHAPVTEEKGKSLWELDSQIVEVLLGRSGGIFDVNKKKSETKAFNIFEQKPDFKNRYGQSLVVNKKDLHSLKKPNLSLFMVNLTAGSMMGPHWNPMASEVSIVLQGEGMIHIVGPSTTNESDNSHNPRFRVGEGDVFVVPRFHPMAQMAFTNGSFVFMGFSSSTKKNHPQFLAGKASVLRTLDKHIVAASFAVTNISMLDRFLDQQAESVILECVSCAEEEFREVMEEIKRRKEEERKREEEEKKKREEEEAKRREEEERKRQEEEARREEEEAKRQEKERKRREAEEEERKREEEARRRREEEARKEEEEAKRKEEERRRREEEERKKREEEEEEEQRREEEARKEEEEASRRREAEEEVRKREEEARRRREEEAKREEEEAKRQEEERQQREAEEEVRKREEEERKRREEEAKREEEEAKRQEQERRQREEQAEIREKEEERARKEEETRRQQEEEAKMEEKEARRQEEERRRQEEGQRREEEKETGGKEEEEEEESRRQEGDKEEEKRRGQGEEVKKWEAEARKKREEAAKREEEEARRQEKETNSRGGEWESKRGEERKGGGGELVNHENMKALNFSDTS